MINLYLDIDGVLLGKKGHLPNGIETFIATVTHQFHCFWLTTHCKGNSETAVRYLDQYYPKSFGKYWQLIHPTNWDVLKTEAISFEKPFFWLDDQPLQAEKIQLAAAGCLDKLMVVDLKNEQELARVLGKLSLIRFGFKVE